MTRNTPTKGSGKAKFVRRLKLTGIFIGGTAAFLVLMFILSALQPLIFAIGMGVAF